MRILWHSNAPHVRTGYGVQTKHFVPRLVAAGHDVAVSAFYGAEGGMTRWQGIPIYPSHAQDYGLSLIGEHSRHWRADLTITLIDAWVMNPKAFGPGVCWAPWFPIDHDPVPNQVWGQVVQATAPICMSRDGLEQCRRRGLDAYYVPHGVDTSIYTPIPQDEARNRLGWPADVPVLLMVAANKGFPDRKGFGQALQALALVRQTHPDAVMFVHSNIGPEMGGVIIPELAKAAGVGDAVRWTDQYQYQYIGYDDAFMATLYSAADVLLNPAMGEGFGVPILEAQACGLPVVVGDWTAMSELATNGVAIQRDRAVRTWTQQNSWQWVAGADAIAEAAVGVLGRSAQERAQASLAGVRWARGYDVEVVTRDYWLPILEQIAGRRARVAAAVEAMGGSVEIAQ